MSAQARPADRGRGPGAAAEASPAAVTGRLAALSRRCTLAFEQLDRKPARERAALAAVVLAALIAAEALYVLPQRDRSAGLAAINEAEQRAAEEALQTQRAQLAAETQALQARLALVEQQLRQLGAGGDRGDTLAGWLRRALLDQPVRLVELRGLEVRELEPPAASGASGANSEGAEGSSPPTAAAAPAPAAPVAPLLFRHRYEITLAGEVGDLTAAVQTLGERMTPLHIERVRLWSADGKAVQATVGFVVLTSERTWISL